MDKASNISAICDFLIKYPPFDNIEKTDLEKLAEGVNLEYYEKNDTIVTQNDKPKDYFFMIKKGQVNIVQNKDGQNILIDRCDEGDVFGIRASIAQDSYIATATVADETLIYTIPIYYFNEIVEKNPKVALFLASGFASGISILREDYVSNLKDAQKNLQKPSSFSKLIEIDSTDIIEIDIKNQTLISCKAEDTIWQAAKKMKVFEVDSIVVVDTKNRPIGIVTDSDFRNKVVSEEMNVKNKSVTEIMSTPVLTIPNKMSTSEIMLMMVNKKVNHFCVTADGSTDGKAIGIVSQKDLILAQGNNPAVLAKQIIKTHDIDKIKAIRDKAEKLISRYLNQEVGIQFISRIITEINDILIDQVIKIARNKLHKEGFETPAIQYCWVSIGSDGRKEQLLKLELRNAIIIENNDKENKNKEYFLKLADEVNTILLACGFQSNTNEMFSNNKHWCLTVDEWKAIFTSWVNEVDAKKLQKVSLFFDLRPITGNAQLADELKNHIFKSINQQPIFLSYFAKSALQSPPPLSFFRSFIVEKSGAHKNEFDIKARAMMPLSSGARVLSLDFNLPSYLSTIERFEAIANQEPSLKVICEAAANAYEILLRHRTISGLKNKNSGQFINPNQFNKIERQVFRNTFKTIEKLQQLLETRYKLGFNRQK